MDGSCKSAGMRAGNGMTATVVRQFAPSRIEGQLLAQAFELVYGLRREKEQQSDLAASSVGPAHRGGNGEQALEVRLQGGV
jgi:hypothetical protein